jgi:hypothetical protein
MANEPEPPFFWPMSAERYRLTILSFIGELITSIETGRPFPCRLIVNLLPINMPNEDAERVIARGEFTFGSAESADNKITRRFSNSGSSFNLRISDAVLKDYSIEIPPDWGGTASHNYGTRTTELEFTPPLFMELPRLTEMGVPRSQFQHLVRMRSDGRAIASELEDDSIRDRKTIIDVALDPSSSSIEYYEKKFGKVIKLGGPHIYCGGGGTGGPWDPNDDDNWYVYQQNKENGACTVRQGPMSDAWYVWRFGPGTEADADAYWRQHCQYDGESGAHEKTQR